MSDDRCPDSIYDSAALLGAATVENGRKYLDMLIDGGEPEDLALIAEIRGALREVRYALDAGYSPLIVGALVAGWAMSPEYDAEAVGRLSILIGIIDEMGASRAS